MGFLPFVSARLGRRPRCRCHVLSLPPSPPPLPSPRSGARPCVLAVLAQFLFPRVCLFSFGRLCAYLLLLSGSVCCGSTHSQLFPSKCFVDAVSGAIPFRAVRLARRLPSFIAVLVRFHSSVASSFSSIDSAVHVSPICRNRRRKCINARD